MAIIRNKKIEKNLEQKVYWALLEEFKKVKTPEEIDDFFEKFMTSNEKTIFVRRFAVMYLLGQNRKYRDIKDLLQISSGTISNIRDIKAGRGYGKNPNRKRKYSSWKTDKKFKKFTRKYKGATNIIDLL